MKRTNTSGRALSSVALAMMTRLVCLSKSGASDDFMISRVLPASSSATPNGCPAHVDLSSHGGGHGRRGIAGRRRLELDVVVLLQSEHAGMGGGAVVGIGHGLAREVLRTPD